MSRMLFVNLPVADLDRSVAFFTALGFSFNPQFTDKNATCMLIGQDAFAMLLVRPFFETFSPRPVADTHAATAAILAVSTSGRAEVDTLFEAAIAQGAKPAKDTVDQGFMYYRSFYDLDGHHWEVMYMDPAAMGAAN